MAVSADMMDFTIDDGTVISLQLSLDNPTVTYTNLCESVKNSLEQKESSSNEFKALIIGTVKALWDAVLENTAMQDITKQEKISILQLNLSQVHSANTGHTERVLSRTLTNATQSRAL